MSEQDQIPNWWEMMLQNFKWKQFIVGAMIPIITFYVFHRLGEPLTGALLAIGWGIGLTAVTHLVLKNVNAFAILSIPLATLQMGGIIATRNPDIFLIWPAVGKTIWGLAFLGSLVVSRPLILVLAEAMGMIPKTEAVDEFRKSDLATPVWNILTGVWGTVMLTSALIVVISFFWLPLEPHLFILTVTGLPLLAALFTFNFWFPVWYVRRSMKSDPSEIEKSKIE